MCGIGILGGRTHCVTRIGVFNSSETGVEQSDLFWVTDAQMTRLRPCFSKLRGKLRVDDLLFP